MDDRQQILQLYHDMYAAMTAKDEAELDRVHDDSFVLIHMTGMRQTKQQYIRAIMDGTLNYSKVKRILTLLYIMFFGCRASGEKNDLNQIL